MLRAERARDGSARHRVTAALKMKGKKHFSAGWLVTAAIKDEAQRIVQTSCEAAQWREELGKGWGGSGGMWVGGGGHVILDRQQRDFLSVRNASYSFSD